MYKFESELVKDFEKILENSPPPFYQLDLGFEFDYFDGRVDVIGKTFHHELISFEAKLTNWRKALHQAYRATSFSHYAYVVLPHRIALNAFKYFREFERRNVGLCSVEGDEIIIQIPALRCTPFQPWITSIALNYIS